MTFFKEIEINHFPLFCNIFTNNEYQHTHTHTHTNAHTFYAVAMQQQPPKHKKYVILSTTNYFPDQNMTNKKLSTDSSVQISIRFVIFKLDI